ncbi:MAG: hypothetical protein IPQ25_15605 [Chitinophagaceae bacterium]|nr:hypothetical protein [Chitinophagaceae bacterium]HQV86512.1 hypothetical protein [Chitinophagaceae bacterium]HQX73254.1 hypothetical protein [Chitinophagaceae bacterium]HQZ74238.1 hypothetical protein [Chitinophagaceae bacterium]
MKFINRIVILILATALINSCKKQYTNTETLQLDKTQFDYKNLKVPNNFFKELPVPGVADPTNAPTSNLIENGTSPDPNNGDDPIILGQQVPNPYTIANMQQAYLQLYGSTAPVPVTHLYIRYKPATQDQLATLLNQPNLELQDYPMDYKVLQDGDYYQDPTLGTEDIGWLYSAVPANYTPVAGIQYEVIQQLHIPANDDLLLEGMAESLAGGAIYDDTVIVADRYITRVDEPSDTLILPNRLPVPCEIDPCAPGCDPTGCGGGGGGGGGTYNPQIPRGTIQVQDQRTCNTVTTPIVNVPVRQARIVCKRWFKIWTGYTNDQGQFLATKRFRNKVKVILKTENNNAKVAKVRGIRLWQIAFPVKKRLGVFDQIAMANISYLFEKPNPTNAHDKELPYWVATTTHNSVLEYGQYAGEVGILNHPTKLNIIVTNWGFQRGAGAAPMWNKCHVLNSELNLLQGFVQYFIAQPLLLSVPIVNLVEVLKNETDVIIGYAATVADYNCLLTSSTVKAIVYHELGHTSHFAQAGCDNWQVYRTRISNELAETFGGDPYGDGTETNAGIVAVGEMWGNHCEKWFSERHYTNPARETISLGQNGIYINDGSALANYGGYLTFSLAGLNANFASIENFDPNRAADAHRWIPQGLCYDLFDPRNDASFGGPLFDNVTGFTIQQCFNALQSDVRTIPAFRDRLLQQNGNNQQVQVNALVNAYNY